MGERAPAVFWLDGGAPGAAPLWRCAALELPGVRHGFGTRHAARAGSGAVATAVGVPLDALFQARQVHGAQVVVVASQRAAGELAGCEADALITDRPGTAVGVRTADCVPLLVADTRCGVVAAIHAGWRGLACGVIEATIDRLERDWGCRPAELVVVAGPAIGVEAYEVGEEVVAGLGHLGAAWVAPAGARRPHLDLRVAAGELLRRGGVRHYVASTHCTWRDAAWFHSYRREGVATGRQLSVIGLEPRS